jgi:hypothetical protein
MILRCSSASPQRELGQQKPLLALRADRRPFAAEANPDKITECCFSVAFWS